MSNVVIKAENIGKKYVIGHKAQNAGNKTIREVLTQNARSLWGKTKDLLAGKPIIQGYTLEDIWALKDVNFEIRQGEAVGIIGRNGAGKSTLLKILSRIIEPSTGRATIKGRVSSLLEVGTGFHAELTGRENIYLNGTILGMNRTEIKRKFDEIVTFAEVEKYLDTPVKRYSSGMYVRLAFAVAAHLEPDILIVDEVLAVGDAQFQKKCLGKMEDVARVGRTVLFVSHNMGAINALCEKCILLEHGILKEYGFTSKIIAKYNSIEKQVEVVTINSNMRNRGDGSLRFKTCSLTDNSGHPKTSFFIGEEIRVEIVLESNFIGKMSFWLIVMDSSGAPLLSSHQRDVEVIEINKGTYKLIYETEKLGLMPGNYTITAGAFDTRLKFLEWIDGCQSFEVYSTFLGGVSFDGRWGAVNQPAKWILEQQ